MEPVIVAYIPVLHEGYRRLFERHPEAKRLFLFDESLVTGYEHLIKDIRRIEPALMKSAIESWKMFEAVELLDKPRIQELQSAKTALIVSDDDVTTELVNTHLNQNPITVDTVFLRWDKKKSIEPTQVAPDVEMSDADFDREMIRVAMEEGTKSRDWWRRIGALAVKDGKMLFRAHNRYVPSDQTANDEGDPRGNFSSGVHFESSLALHAEASLVAQAAKEGVSLNGADVYCDTFPCPPCAKQLAYAGIRTLYYRNGYAVLDGERILKSQDVKIIFVRPVSDSSSVART